MINALKKYFPGSLKYFLKYYFFDGYAQKSYSQEGEDMILRRIFERKKSGFYIDVGAHHPKRFSNTYFFYKQGWSGINIDAMPGSMSLFKKNRSRDTNLEIPVSSTSGVLTYYSFNEPALNGFDSVLSEQREKEDNGYKIIDKIDLQTRTLSDILDDFVPNGKEIDFLSVDVEGLDYDVLVSNNWVKYQPSVVLVEAIGSSLDEINSSEITSFLKSHGYRIYSKAVNTVIYRLQ